jgi:hypothetical protein
MPAIGKVESPDGCGSVGATKGSSESLPLRLSFVISAYNAAQWMIRFSDKKASFVFLFFGIILTIFGIRGDRILVIGRTDTGRGDFALCSSCFSCFCWRR